MAKIATKYSVMVFMAMMSTPSALGKQTRYSESDVSTNMITEDGR